MGLLTILEFPDERLRKQAALVKQVNAEIKALVQDMFATMYAAQGVGLAATQVNVHQRIIVVDVSEEKNAPLCLINPIIIESEGEAKTSEGCLSVPGIFESVARAQSIRVQGWNELGENVELQADGLLSVCIQHEMDHLQGKLFVDYLSSLKRQRIKKKLEKAQRAPR